MSKLLLLGPNGQLGYELAQVLKDRFEIHELSSAELDLAQPDAVHQAIETHQPALVVNASAYTAVDKAETDSELAYLVNEKSVQALAEATKKVGGALVHFSTDFVFDGKLDRPYTESDAAAPLNVYGKSKLAGEQAVLASGCPALIFRTSWLYSTRRNNFLLTMARLFRTKEAVSVVSDQIGTPTTARDVARVVAEILPTDDDARQALFAEHGGLYHLSCEGACSWYEFAAAIHSRMDAAGGSLAALSPIPSAEYPTPAERPAYSVMDKSALKQAFGVAPKDWEAALDEVFAELAI